MTDVVHDSPATRDTPDGLLFAERYRAIAARDARFDGQFFTAVRTTGIYCRPSCPARTPKPSNVTFYLTSAAAHDAGFRACKRCLPEATPGTPEWNLRRDLAGRAMRLIADGVVDRDGVEGLAVRLGYSVRQINRLLVAELGAGPLALARAQRAQTARALLTGTDLKLADVAFAAGFGSIRQFNDTIAEIFAATPSEIRARGRGARGGDGAVGGLPRGRAIARTTTRETPDHTEEYARDRVEDHGAERQSLRLSLPVRLPFDARGVLEFLAARAVDGVESADLAGPALRYARTVALPHGPGAFEVRYQEPDHGTGPAATVLPSGTDGRDRHSSTPAGEPGATVRARGGVPGADRAGSARGGAPGADRAGSARGGASGADRAASVGVTLEVTHLADVPVAVSRIRRLLDLDADPVAVDDALGADPGLAASVAAVPGIRVPGAVDAGELLVRAIVGQQISVAAARTHLSRLAAAVGTPYVSGIAGLSRLFPTPDQVADGARDHLRLPSRNVAAIESTTRALAAGDLTVTVGDDADDLRERLVARPGIGPWTAGYVALRVLGDPDVLMDGDVALLAGARTLGLLDGEAKRSRQFRELAERGSAWAPWRSYAAMHLWRNA
ncbi:DNA-3-methyladenine glycosylase 2 family protein [Myceligenerans pegani]|uniref:DNA-3-methyladenine glycosylase II n=1 Tax=Myceligenerans pegani TaxID=2776917 RepID=A0ABR9MUJ8_9MICO|nr:Ada metal-binding domain-containing protein [Myceligenerans sp. TRM 65318]MBE1874447.1 DNA-3-methyladenine glycosylase 2 family protein [Myceligenerans sp. TRM 65318]MBE3016718.1 DNA-3-methyladenine glycosylase 2 family protein [Myceligenerans sp. TRM 65318]